MNNRMRMKRRANRRLPDPYRRFEIVLVITDEGDTKVVEKAYDLWGVAPKFASHDFVLAYHCNPLITKNHRSYSQEVLQKAFGEWTRKTISNSSESDNEEEVVES